MQQATDIFMAGLGIGIFGGQAAFAAMDGNHGATIIASALTALCCYALAQALRAAE